jgi:hypothetical protein
MDELTLLREHRADVPGPSAAETAAARRTLLTAIKEAQLADRARVSRLTRHSARLGNAGDAGGQRVGWRRAAAASLTAASVAAISITVGLAGGRMARPRSGTFPLTAAHALREAGQAAAQHPHVRWRYFFVESEYVSDDQISRPGVYTWQGPILRRIWIGNTVAGRLRDPLVRGKGYMPIPPGKAFWAELRHLPTNTRKLRARIAAMSAIHPNQSLASAEFDTVLNLLEESPASSALRAALYRVAAELPGIRLVRGAHDLVGRAATEVYMPGGFPGIPGGGGEALFFDVRTGMVLGFEQVTGSGPQCPPLWDDAELAMGYVNSVSAMPPGTPRQPLRVHFAKRVSGCRWLPQGPAPSPPR